MTERVAGGLVGALVLFLAPALAFAQVTLKPDGQWRYLLSAGASVSSGNNDATTLNLSAEGARQTAIDKWTWDAKADRARSSGVSTVERFGLRTQYNRDFSLDGFAFGSGEWLRDRLANLDARYSVATGVGRHVWSDEQGFFDVSAGLGYAYDRYVAPTTVAGSLRDTYGRAELVLAEESSHKLTDTTRFRQKFAVYPDLRDRGKYRALLDAGLTVAMTKSINLTAGLTYRYDSDPGTGLEKADAMFVTGVSMRLD
ncbi:MAG: DUF481 domain-containing protein [Hydrogenophaga sp.]|uniref:DUF481 domain-containing protein n=1 Tax=Hydrogenophaga sp. TaxID=1904254 RepID=UPI001DE712CC|nr:DUF481 domain-containing protein [Hydrogenophaga sp.]MBX3609458.1 DUF481 domain-containing protein [Hydrogenophaga sp.]